MVDRAVQQYCGPLEELARGAQALRQRLEESAAQIRGGLLGEIATFDNASSVATCYRTQPATPTDSTSFCDVWHPL